MSQNSITQSQSGLPMTLERNFELSMLEDHPRMLVIKEDSSLLYLQRRNKVVTVTLCDNEQEAFENISRITQIADIEVNPESFFTNRFSFNADSLEELLFDAEENFESLINTLVDLGGEIDTDNLIDCVLQIKKVYSTEYIFQTIRNMGAEDVEILLKTDNPLTFFNHYIRGEKTKRSDYIDEPYEPNEALMEAMLEEDPMLLEDYESYEEISDEAFESDDDYEDD